MILLLLACAHAPPSDAHATIAATTSTRIVLIGDTGTVDDGDPAHINSGHRDIIKGAIDALDATAVFALGDLYYWAPPRCPGGRISEKKRGMFEQKLTSYLGQLGTTTYLVMGNHEIGPIADFVRNRAPARAACYRTLAAESDTLELPDLTYQVAFGDLLHVEVLNTNTMPNPTASAQLAARLSDAKEAGKWTMIAAHHVLRTYDDKEGEGKVGAWLAAQPTMPDLYVNGHAHMLQLGVYDHANKGVKLPAPVITLTSGAGAKQREVTECRAGAGNPAAGTCGDGQLYGAEKWGFASLDVTKETLDVRFFAVSNDTTVPEGCWRFQRGSPVPIPC